MSWITDAHPVLLGLLQLAVVGVPACMLAWLLRRAAIPGGAPAAAIVGGIITGLLIGATVGGRVLPEAHDRLFIGGVDQAIARADLHRKHVRERAVLQATGVSIEAMPELEEQQRREAAIASEEIEIAKATHRRRFRLAAACVFALIGAGCIGSITTRRWSSVRAQVLPMTVGTVLAGAAATLIAHAIGLPWPAAIALGAALSLPGITRQLVTTRHALLPLRATTSLWLPACAALLASVIDVPECVGQGRFWWLLALGIVASSDLRWVCYWAAIRGVARQWWGAYPWSIASRWMRDGAATVQLVLTFLAFGLDRNVDEIIAASLVGAATIELTRNLRSSIAAALDRDSFEPRDD